MYGFVKVCYEVGNCIIFLVVKIYSCEVVDWYVGYFVFGFCYMSELLYWGFCCVGVKSGFFLDLVSVFVGYGVLGEFVV